MKFRVYLLACLIIPSSLWAKITEVKYSYDKLGRLSSVVYASNERANEFYTYDEQGNLAEKKIGEISCTYKYDKLISLLLLLVQRENEPISTIRLDDF